MEISVKTTKNENDYLFPMCNNQNTLQDSKIGLGEEKKEEIQTLQN